MDKQVLHHYKKNTTNLFAIAAIIIAISLLAAVFVLTPNRTPAEEMSVLITTVLWIGILFGSIVGEGKNSTVFNAVISVLGFICAFVLALALFVQKNSTPLSLFLFWVSQVLSSIFILSTYFSIESYLESKKNVEPKKKTAVKKAVRKRKTTK